MSLHSTSGRWQLGLILSLITAFLWGILPIALKVSLQVLDASTVTWFRFIVSFLLLGAVLASRQNLPNLRKLNRQDWILFLIAVIFLAINYILFLVGLNLTTAANTQVLIQLAPVLMGLGGLVVFKERYNRLQWVGVGILTLGFTLFFHEQLSSLITARGQYLFGSGIIVIAAAAWAVYALAQKQLLNTLHSPQIMLMLYGSCAILFTPFSHPQPIPHLSFLHLGMLIFCALNTFVAYGAFAESLEHWEASKVSAILATTPIVTLSSVMIVSTFFPTLITPEKISILSILGAVFVVVGSVTIALGKQKSESVKSEQKS